MMPEHLRVEWLKGNRCKGPMHILEHAPLNDAAAQPNHPFAHDPGVAGEEDGAIPPRLSLCDGGDEAEDASKAPPTGVAALIAASIPAAPPVSKDAVMGPFVPESDFTKDPLLVCKDCGVPVVSSAKGVRKTSKNNNTYHGFVLCVGCLANRRIQAMGPRDESELLSPRLERKGREEELRHDLCKEAHRAKVAQRRR